MLSSMQTRCLGILGICAGLIVAAVLLAEPATGASPEADESVLFYPSYLTWDAREGHWSGTIRGKIYEREDGVSARLTLATLRAALGILTDLSDEEERVFRSRAREFAVDHERDKRITIACGARTFVSRPSQPNGHFSVDVVVREGKAGEAVPFTVRLESGDSRQLSGESRLVAPSGLSVISDVDDTVKDSNVLDRSELVANTFCRPHRPVEGMPGRFAAWGGQGVVFHYVTASPWQLYLSIRAFLDDHGFPLTEIQMRHLRLSDSSVVDFFRDSQAYKTARVEEILRRFPERSFVLIGDSGERDPAVYAGIAAKHPDRVAAIFIRAVREEDRDRARYSEIFRGVEGSKWVLFDDPAALPPDLGAWLSDREAPASVEPASSP